MNNHIIIPKGNVSVRARAAQAVTRLNPGKTWRLELSEVKPKRTKRQNGLMWAWLNEVADIVGAHTGYDADDMHMFFKQKFLPASGRKIIEIQGELYERYTTTALSVGEFAEYLNAIDRWVAENLGVVLPIPEQAYEG